MPTNWESRYTELPLMECHNYECAKQEDRGKCMFINACGCEEKMSFEYRKHLEKIGFFDEGEGGNAD